MPTANRLKPTSPPVCHLSFTVTSVDTSPSTSLPNKNKPHLPSYDEFMASTQLNNPPHPIDPPPAYSPFCITDVLIPPSYHFKHRFFKNSGSVSTPKDPMEKVTRKY